jgi:hypothetical protein
LSFSVFRQYFGLVSLRRSTDQIIANDEVYNSPPKRLNAITFHHQLEEMHTKQPHRPDAWKHALPCQKLEYGSTPLAKQNSFFIYIYIFYQDLGGGSTTIRVKEAGKVT